MMILSMTIGESWGWSEMLWTTLISIGLVFAILILLVFVMRGFGAIFGRQKKPAATTPAGKVVEQGQLHEEEIAAVVAALELYRNDLHDRESDVLTILSIKRAYSPWNSKIHGLTQMPDKK